MLSVSLTALAVTDQTILHLRNGDRVAGSILREDTNAVVLVTEWMPELIVPTRAIVRREKPAPVAAKPPQKPPNQAKTTQSEDKFKGNARLGLDFLNGRRNRQFYYGRFKLEYEHPYVSNPQKSFRTALDYTADFGETDGRRSANRMDGGLKADWDTGERVYVYNLAAGGYDEIRKVDLRYEVGPGVGYHLFRQPTLKLDVEVGFNYQAQQRVGSADVQDFNWRLGERLVWKLAPRFTISENAELSPRVTDPEVFDARLEANLAYSLTDSLSLNFSILDLYDTQPAKEVNRNEFQLRSSVGVAF